MGHWDSKEGDYNRTLDSKSRSPKNGGKKQGEDLGRAMEYEVADKGEYNG